MAKKNTGKVIQMLTPENYIRTKGRTLPLYECRVSNGWEEAKQASCVISRKHSNGNITYCFYFVDLLCFGVKSTYFVFNETMLQYEDFIAGVEEDIPMEIVDYALVHNIIHAGIEYAEEYEFKPCKDFNTITQYFLEKDTDDIELIEIECGSDDGQPVYLYSSSNTPAQEKNRIIAQLERTAGPGNYVVTDEDDFDEEDYPDDDFDDPEDLYSHLTFEENSQVFIDLYKGLDDSKDPNDLVRLTRVTDELFTLLTDRVMVDQYYDELFNLLAIDVESKGINKELLGVKTEVETNDVLNELFMTVFMNIYKNLKKAREGLELLQIRSSGLPAAAFLELLILQKENSKTYAETLQKYAKAYPDYSLITLVWLIDIYQSEHIPEDILSKTFNLDTLFPGRESLHFLEMFYYLMFNSNVVAFEKNTNKMEAFYLVLDEFELPEDITDIVRNSFSLSRIGYLCEYFGIE